MSLQESVESSCEVRTRQLNVARGTATEWTQHGPVTGAGGKGKSKQHTPVEAPNTLRSKAVARVVDVISEGEIYGLSDQSHPKRCIYFDDVPVESSDGTENFEGVVFYERKGLPTQDVIPGFTEVESEVTINIEATTASPVLWSVADSAVDAIRVTFRIPALYEQKTNGDLVGATIQWKIQCQPQGGSFDDVVTITLTGKTSSAYEQQTRVDLEALGTFPLTFKVVRITADSEQATLQNELYVEGYTELQEAKLMYPDTALVALKVDSELFGGRVPRRGYLVKGIKIKVPVNYDPDARTYTGFWNGTFQTAWTNNPAWVLYDLLTNERYGLGLATSQVDKYALYAVAQYCDELVPDGFGGTEPRFALNGVINERKEAFEVIQALVSVFRGMAYWSAGGVTVTQDSPQDPKRLFGKANVIGGKFTYSGTGLKARHTQALVSFNDPSNNYKQDIEVVDDPELIAKYGLRPIEVAAFATTSRGQARRMGRWILDSEANETETIVFAGGFDCADVRPGDIIQVNDPSRAGVRRAGRIMANAIPSLLGTTAESVTIAKLGTFSLSAGSFVAGQIDRLSQALFQCRIFIPTTIQPSGVIFEAGNSTNGAYLGFDASGNLVLRAGDGASSPSVTTSAKLVIAAGRIEKGRELDLVWMISPAAPAKVELWINNTYYGEAGTSAGGAFPSSGFATTDGGGYGTKNGNTVAGEVVTDFNGELRSSLTYWRAGVINHVLAAEQVLDGTFVAGDNAITAVFGYAGSGISRANNGMIALAFEVPTGTPTGVLFELGNSTTGTYLGFDGSGNLIIRAGDGSSTLTSSTLARMVIPTANIPRDRVNHLIVEWTPLAARLRVWLNWEFYSQVVASSGSLGVNNVIATTDAGGYGLQGGSGIVAGESSGYASNFSGTLRSVLSYFEGAQFSAVSRAFSAASLTLDAEHTAQIGDVIYLTLEDSTIDMIPLLAPAASSTLINLSRLPSRAVLPNAMYLVQGSSLYPEEWRVISVTEQDTHQYQITGLKYDRTKYDRIEKNLVIDPEPTSLLPTGAVKPPRELTVTESLYKTNNAVNTRVDINWRASTDPRAMLYRVEVLPPDGNWQTLTVTSALAAQIANAAPGQWTFKVSAISSFDQPTSGTSSISKTQTIVGKTAPPADVTGLTANRSFTAVELRWTAVTDLDLIGYEVRQGTTWDAGTVVASRHISTQIVIPFTTTSAITYHVRAVDDGGRYSVNAATITAQAPALSAVTGFVAYQVGSQVRLVWDPIKLAETVQYELRQGTTSNTWDNAGLLDTTPASQWTGPFAVNSSTTVRFRIKPYIELAGGFRSYGSETTFDRTIHPRIGQNLVQTQNEHTTWNGESARSPYTLVNGVITPTAANETITSGTTLDSQNAWVTGNNPPFIGRLQSAVFKVTIKVPTGVTPVGTIFELGNSTRGGLLAFNGSGDLVFRAGDAAASPNVNDVARLVVSNANIPSNKDFTILCDIRCDGTNSGRVRLWIDGKKMGEDATDNGAAFSAWASTADGKFNGNDGTVVAGESGSYSQAVTTSGVLLQSSLSYWANQLVDESLEITGSNELALKDGSTFGAYRYAFTMSTQRFVRLWYQATALFLSANEKLINDFASTEINSGDFAITPVSNFNGVPNITYFLEFSPEVPFEQADYQFTTVTIRVEFRRNPNDNIRPALSALTTLADLQSNMP